MSGYPTVAALILLALRHFSYGSSQQIITITLCWFVLKINITPNRFLLGCNVVVGSMIAFVPHVELICVKFLSPCNIFIGNVFVFGLETMLDFFCFAIMLLLIWLFMIKGNLASVRFPSLWQCYWKCCACVWARSCVRFLLLCNVVVFNLVVYYRRKYNTC